MAGRRGCNYFEWHDDPFHPQVVKLIKELHNKVGNFKYENKLLKSIYGDRSKNIEIYKMEVECRELWRKIKAVKDENGKNKCKVWFLGATLFINWY